VGTGDCGTRRGNVHHRIDLRDRSPRYIPLRERERESESEREREGRGKEERESERESARRGGGQWEGRQREGERIDEIAEFRA